MPAVYRVGRTGARNVPALGRSAAGAHRSAREAAVAAAPLRADLRGEEAQARLLNEATDLALASRRRVFVLSEPTLDLLVLIGQTGDELQGCLKRSARERLDERDPLEAVDQGVADSDAEVEV
ncbi:MAG: hypothetical protein FJ035_00685 [Chloroflexi bacterium]|nr:hypothetical protein [Chloroflexota bacterium]